MSLLWMPYTKPRRVQIKGRVPDYRLVDTSLDKDYLFRTRGVLYIEKNLYENVVQYVFVRVTSKHVFPSGTTLEEAMDAAKTIVQLRGGGDTCN